MPKPSSIKRFDFLFLGSIVVGMLGLAIGWDTIMAQMESELLKQGVQPDSSVTVGVLLGGFLFATVINLALWFLISILRIEFAKWALIALVAWGIYSMAVAISQSGFAMIQISGFISTIMSVAAIAMLFQPDAKEWFAAKRGE